jgi:hypothetical protein
MGGYIYRFLDGFLFRRLSLLNKGFDKLKNKIFRQGSPNDNDEDDDAGGGGGGNAKILI